MTDPPRFENPYESPAAFAAWMLRNHAKESAVAYLRSCASAMVGHPMGPFWREALEIAEKAEKT